MSVEPKELERVIKIKLDRLDEEAHKSKQSGDEVRQFVAEKARVGLAGLLAGWNAGRSGRVPYELTMAFTAMADELQREKERVEGKERAELRRLIGKYGVPGEGPDERR